MMKVNNTFLLSFLNQNNWGDHVTGHHQPVAPAIRTGDPVLEEDILLKWNL